MSVSSTQIQSGNGHTRRGYNQAAWLVTRDLAIMDNRQDSYIESDIELGDQDVGKMKDGAWMGERAVGSKKSSPIHMMPSPYR